MKYLVSFKVPHNHISNNVWIFKMLLNILLFFPFSRENDTVFIIVLYVSAILLSFVIQRNYERGAVLSYMDRST